MLKRPQALPVALALLAPIASPQAIDGDLVAVHPFSVPGPIVSDAAGQFVFVAEGGSVTGLEVAQQFVIRSKRPVGTAGVRPIDLRLDPGADLALDDAPGFEDVLYLAAGRSGLWAMTADLRAHATSQAVRIDDSRDAEPDFQNSRRWCNAVEVMTVGGREYLVALFAQRSDSRLRVYCLDDVRALVAAGVELGAELKALYDVPLLSHPAARSVASLDSVESIALAMDVDPGPPGQFPPGAEQANVYVAMGPHGLVRVGFRPANFPDEPCSLPWSQVVQGPGVQWGPVYGDGTWAHTSSSPPDKREWYSSFTYDVGDPNWNRTDPPFFTDVAIQSFAGGHFLYATVEHRGWVRYALGVGQAWHEQADVDHHEGKLLNPATHSWGQVHIELLPPSEMDGNRYIYASRIEVVERTNGEAALVVSTQEFPTVRQNGHRSEIFALGHVGATISGVNGWEKIKGDHARTIVYAVPPAGFSGVFNYHSFIPAGGVGLFVPDSQTVAGELSLFTGRYLANPVTNENIERHATLRITADLSAPGSTPSLTHRRNDPRGRFNFGVGASIVDPNVLVSAANDAGLRQDGFLTVCPQSSELVAHYNDLQNCPGTACGNDLRGSAGILFNNSGQWRHKTIPDTQYLFGASNPPSGGPVIWRISKIDVGTERCTPTTWVPGPDVVVNWFVAPPLDRFGGKGRGFLQTGSTSAAYNAEHDRSGGNEPWEVLFATRVGTPDGVVVLRRDIIEEYFETSGPGGAPLPRGTILDLDPNHHPPPIDYPIIAQLETHPELSNVPGSEDEGSPGDFMLQNPAISTETLTTHPKLFKLRSPGSLVADTWVLAVPCGTIVSNPDVFAGLPGDWAPPPPFDTSFHRSLVQFWTVQDPATISPRADLPRIIGDDDRGNAFFIDTAEVDLDPLRPGPETYCFIADFGGRVLVYDVTRLLQPAQAAPQHVETWNVPPSVSDGYRSNIFNLAVDVEPGRPASVFVYVPVTRSGIAVLSFDPNRAPGQRLLRVRSIETPGESMGVTLLVDETTGERKLLASDHSAGVRIFR